MQDIVDEINNVLLLWIAHHKQLLCFTKKLTLRQTFLLGVSNTVHLFLSSVYYFYDNYYKFGFNTVKLKTKIWYAILKVVVLVNVHITFLL